MSQPPSFNFGASASTSASPGTSLFGTTTNSGGGLFGGGNNQAGAGSGFSFGNLGKAPPASSTEEKKPLFGAAAGNSSGNLFSQPSAAGTSSSPFNMNQNQKLDDKGAPSNTVSSFGGFGGFGSTLQTPAKPSAPTSSGATQPAGLFGASTGGASGAPFGAAPSAQSGSTTPAQASSGPNFSFGGPSTTPAGPPPSTNAFGASTGGAGLFNLGGQSVQQSGGLFNTKPSTQDQPAPSAPNTTTQSNSGNGAFATIQQPSASGGLFAPKPVQAGTSMFSAFGKPKEASTSADQNTSAPAQAPNPLFDFGKPSNAPGTSATASSLFSPAPAANQSATSLFSKPTSASNGSTGSKQAFSFPSQNTASGTTAPASSSSVDSGATKPLFGLGPPSTSQPTSIPSTTTGSLFNLPNTANGSSTAASESNTATSNQATPSLFSGLGQSTSISAQPITSTAAVPPPSTSASAPAVSGPGASTLGTSTTGPIPPSQSRLRNKTMDDILTRWASDLTKYTKQFKSQAETVGQWDQILVDNMAKISKLYANTVTSEKQTASVEMQLAAVENQQNELDSWLTKYENEVNDMLAKNGPDPSEMAGPDQERERTYKLAEKLGERLEDMSRDLESMIEEVNSANASLNKATKADEPVSSGFSPLSCCF